MATSGSGPKDTGLAVDATLPGGGAITDDSSWCSALSGRPAFAILGICPAITGGVPVVDTYGKNNYWAGSPL